MKAFLRYLAVALVFVFFATPIFWTLLTSVKPTRIISAWPPALIFTPTLEHYVAIFTENRVQRPLTNSAIIATLSTLVVMFIAAPAAYALSRFRVFGSKHLLFYFLTARMAPPISVILPLFLIFRSLGLIDTHLAMIAAYLTFNMPFAIWMLKGFVDEIPKELDEAALVDGCTRFRAFWNIVLPLTGPGLAAIAIISFIFAWNDFLFALILTSFDARTLPVAASAFMTDRLVLWGKLCATALLIFLPVMLFALLVRNYLIKGLTFGAVKE